MAGVKALDRTGKPHIVRGATGTRVNVTWPNVGRMGPQGPVGPPGGSDASFAALVTNPASETSVALADKYAPVTRTLTTGSGLTGGGNLSADRTLAVDLATVAPLPVAATGVVGTSPKPARQDHVHAYPVLETLPLVPYLTAGMVSSGEGVEAYRRSGVVTIRVYVSCSTAGGIILTLPTGWRPPGAIRSDMNPTITTNRAVLLSTNGQLSVEGGMTVGMVMFGSMTFVVA